MEITSTYHGTFDDGEFPAVVYKYRDWDYSYHDRYIKNREVYLAAPSSFEDKVDCKIPVRYDLLNEKQTMVFAMRLSKMANPHFTRQQHRKDIREWAKQKLLKNQAYLDDYQKLYDEQYDIRLGVLSLTAEPFLDAMWEKYANLAKGFCIGYNSHIMFEYLGGGGAVNYLEQLPILLPEPIMSWHQIRTSQIFSKEIKWNFEKEYRTHMFWESAATITNRQIKLPREAFNKIILGKNISTKHKLEIESAVKDNIGDIPVIEYNNVC
jgi:hypothetical protein